MPSLSWLTARAEIAVTLTGIAIEFPLVQSIQRVYETPPKQVSDFPCLIIMGTAKDPPERSSGLRQRDYTARIRLIVEDADLDRAADIIDAFEEAMIVAFDGNLTLNGLVSNLIGPSFLEPGFVDVGGQEHRGVDAFVRFRMLDAPGFS